MEYLRNLHPNTSGRWMELAGMSMLTDGRILPVIIFSLLSPPLGHFRGANGRSPRASGRLLGLSDATRQIFQNSITYLTPGLAPASNLT